MATSGAGAIPQEPSSLVSEIGTLTGIQGLPVRLSQLNNKPHLSASPQGWDYKCASRHPDFHVGAGNGSPFLVINLQASQPTTAFHL